MAALLGEWGHEFVRNLAGEIAAEHSDRLANDPPKPVDDLLKEGPPF